MEELDQPGESLDYDRLAQAGEAAVAAVVQPPAQRRRIETFTDLSMFDNNLSKATG